MIRLTITYLIQSDQKMNKVENLMIHFNDQKSNLIKFDPFWKDLIESDRVMNKVEYVTVMPEGEKH